MVHFPTLLFIAACALWLSPSINAAPTPGEKVEQLWKRAISKFEDCDETQRKKAGQAFADAATIARWGFDNKLKDEKEYKDTDAYANLPSLFFQYLLGPMLIFFLQGIRITSPTMVTAQSQKCLMLSSKTMIRPTPSSTSKSLVKRRKIAAKVTQRVLRLQMHSQEQTTLRRQYDSVPNSSTRTQGKPRMI
jgi:hypothetical protein